MIINKVEIYISNFEKTVQFYEQTLQFKLISYVGNSASFQIGESVLEFHKDEMNNHYYHFAFNIHSNLFKQAKTWLAERVELLKEDREDEVYFEGITKANACYLEDPAGNIVEYIARVETSPTSAAKVFSTSNVLSISEIGLSTNELEKYAEQIQTLGIPVRNNRQLYYDTYLNFMGEYEEGAFIILGPLGRRWIFSNKVSVATPVVIHTDRGIISTL
ncbi:VOC family protein [Niallia sp. 03133]|uniref:VOC family protein n=1 Tax=Niallia sp. 03133 TaxID=3458060 RepID=UPI004044BABA